MLAGGPLVGGPLAGPPLPILLPLRGINGRPMGGGGTALDFGVKQNR